MKKSDKIQFRIILCYLIAMLATLVLIIVLKPQSMKYWMVGIFFLITVIGYIGIRFMRNYFSQYRCPHCQHVFRISFKTSLTTKNYPGEGKALTCPNCQVNARMKEESIDESLPRE